MFGGSTLSVVDASLRRRWIDRIAGFAVDNHHDSGNSFSIFVVDDNEENLGLLKEMLSASGYLVFPFTRGKPALQAIRDYLPSLVLLDIQMPGMNGLELCRLLKEDEETAEIPVIFISGLGKSTDIISGFQAGGIDYITKPFHMDEVEARVGTHLALIAERKKTQRLLENVLPKKVIRELKEAGATEPQALDGVSILFADLVDFTRIAASMSARDLIGELNELFSVFDDIFERNDCERIKTIGDAYLAVGGSPTPGRDAAIRLVTAATQVQAYLRDRNRIFGGPNGERRWEIRIGIHTGEIVAGIVGRKKYIYDIFGDSVNTASRIQECSAPMRIGISQDTAELVKARFALEEREPIRLKGKGWTSLFYLRD